MVFNLNKCGTLGLKSSLSVHNECQCEKSRKTFFFPWKIIFFPRAFFSLRWFIAASLSAKEKYESFVCATSIGRFFTARVSKKVEFCADAYFICQKIAFKALSSGMRENFWNEKVCFVRNWVMPKSTLFPKLNSVTLLTVMWLHWNPFPKSFCRRPPQMGQAFVTLDKHVIPLRTLFSFRTAFW